MRLLYSGPASEEHGRRLLLEAISDSRKALKLSLNQTNHD